MTDIKNTKELVKLVVALSGVFKNANEDGKVDINDLALLVAVFPYIGPAINDLSAIPSELKDLDELEMAEISVEVKKIVGSLGGDEKYVDIAERALKAGSEIFEIIKLLK